MTCTSPISGWRARVSNANGRRPIVFNYRDGNADEPVDLPCGRCIGCRLERSRQWAVRCLHEASLHENNCFITLTYNDAHLPRTGSLELKHFQDFMKRLRKRFGNGIRFFHCGEYGDLYRRPHYHACLFNLDFSDKELWQVRDGVKLYTSAALAELWPFGFSTIGDVTYESAAYVARYVTKKITGPAAQDYYQNIDLRTGEIFQIRPEYITMSRRPGIGAGWLRKWKGDVYPSDFLVVNGKKMKPPKFYDRVFEIDNADEFEETRRKREILAAQNIDPGALRLAEIKRFRELTLKKQLRRKLDNET